MDFGFHFFFVAVNVNGKKRRRKKNEFFGRLSFGKINMDPYLVKLWNFFFLLLLLIVILKSFAIFIHSFIHFLLLLFFLFLFSTMNFRQFFSLVFFYVDKMILNESTCLWLSDMMDYIALYFFFCWSKVREQKKIIFFFGMKWKRKLSSRKKNERRKYFTFWKLNEENHEVWYVF